MPRFRVTFSTDIPATKTFVLSASSAREALNLANRRFATRLWRFDQLIDSVGEVDKEVERYVNGTGYVHERLNVVLEDDDADDYDLDLKYAYRSEEKS